MILNKCLTLRVLISSILENGNKHLPGSLVCQHTSDPPCTYCGDFSHLANIDALSIDAKFEPAFEGFLQYDCRPAEIFGRFVDFIKWRWQGSASQYLIFSQRVELVDAFILTVPIVHYSACDDSSM